MLGLYLAFIDDDEEKDLFIKLYEENRSFLLSFVTTFLNKCGTAECEDVVQDTFLAVAKNIKTISQIDCSKRRAFLVIIVKNKARDYMRKKAKISDTPLDDLDFIMESPTQAPIDIVISDIGYTYLKNCVAKLPDTYRETLELKLIGNLSDKEIGELLGIEPKTVTSCSIDCFHYRTLQTFFVHTD